MKPEISIIYSLARSGGTIISRCLGCIPGNILLSEVHPRFSFFHPLIQARDWFDLITEEELLELKSVQKISYLDSIKLISERCQARGLKLIIRDWTHVDFISSPYPASPVYRLSQYELLKEHFDIKQVALVRHPLDSYLSLARLEGIQGTLDLATYMREYRRFSEAIKEMSFFRYEDFCGDPATVLCNMCGVLGAAYDERFTDWFRGYHKITGDVLQRTKNRTLAGDRVGERVQNDIRPVSRRPEHVTITGQLAGNNDYRAILDALGYSSDPLSKTSPK